MRRQLLIYTLFTTIAAFGLSCSKSTTQQHRIELGDQFEIGLGQTVLIESETLTITLRSINFDYRCPLSQNCDWPGIVEASLDVVLGHENPVRAELALAGDFDTISAAVNSIDVGAYRFELVSVSPVPVQTNHATHTVEDSVRAVLIVTESGINTQILGGPSRISSFPIDSIPSTNAEILSCLLNTDTLTLSVRIANPCVRHYFELNLLPESRAEANTHYFLMWLRHTTSAAVCAGSDSTIELKFHVSEFQEYVDRIIGAGREKIFRLSEFESQGEMSNRQFEQSYWGPEADQNKAPVFYTVGPINLRYGQSISVRIHAKDPEDVIPTVRALELPEGATFEQVGEGSGEFRWTPTLNETDTLLAKFEASDNYRSDTMEVPITVRRNNAPAVTQILPADNFEVHKGDRMQVIINMIDADGDSLAYRVLQGLGNCIVTPLSDGSGVNLTAPTTSLDLGVYRVSVEASDGVFADTAAFVMQLMPFLNHPPKFEVSETTVTLYEGTSDYIVLRASDPNDEPLWFRMFNLPKFAYFDQLTDSTMQIRFYPSYTSHDIYLTKAIVSDTRAADTASIRIIVHDQNKEPELNFISTMVCPVGDSVIRTVSASDADGDSLIFSMTGAPPGAVITPSGKFSATFRYNGVLADAGDHEITFSVTDGVEFDSRTTSLLVAGNLPGQAGLIPMAVGNYWVYSWDSLHVWGGAVEDEHTWWFLSGAFGPFTDKVRISDDTLFGSYGPELIVPGAGEITYPIYLHVHEWFPGSYERTAKPLTEPVTVPAGTFAKCVQYELVVKCRDLTYGGWLVGYSEKYVVAPGVGIIKIDKFMSTCTLMSGYSTHSVLLRYDISHD